MGVEERAQSFNQLMPLLACTLIGWPLPLFLLSRLAGHNISSISEVRTIVKVGTLMRSTETNKSHSLDLLMKRLDVKGSGKSKWAKPSTTGPT